MDNVLDRGLAGIASALRSKETTVVSLITEVFERIEDRNGQMSFSGDLQSINAWSNIYPERALAQAARADARLADDSDELPLLTGMPLGLKDLISVKGLPLTASSKVLEGNIAEESADVVKSIEVNAGVIVGHTHTHEFAAGGTTDQVGNPRDLEWSAGGSSGGSAAAIASGMVPFALGTDTGGSVRIPAAFSGISSFKPTRGNLSNIGVVPLAYSLDHVGVMAEKIDDCFFLYSALDAGESNVAPTLEDAESHLHHVIERVGGVSHSPLGALRIGVTSRIDRIGADPIVDAGFKLALAALEALGATIVQAEAPTPEPGNQLDIIQLTELAHHHRKYSQRKGAYSPWLRDIVERGQSEASLDRYLDAQVQRASDRSVWHGWFVDHDLHVLIEPSVKVSGRKRNLQAIPPTGIGGEDPLAAYSLMWNYLGNPVAAVPVFGADDSPTPVGISIIGKTGSDFETLAVASILQAKELGTSKPVTSYSNVGGLL